MVLGLQQDYEYVGNDSWNWRIWLDGDDAELDEVRSVEYLLHPTFPNPVREVKDRSSNFRLVAQGWGVFQLKARVRLADGSIEQLSHMLNLEYPPGADEAAVREKVRTRSAEPIEERRSVFLSAGSADGAVAAVLRESLIEKGVQVWSDDDIPPGAPWEFEIEQAIAKADAVVALSSDVPSKWVEREVDAAREQGTMVIPVVMGDNAVVPKGLESFQQISVLDATALGEATESILLAMDQ